MKLRKPDIVSRRLLAYIPVAFIFLFSAISVIDAIDAYNTKHISSDTVVNIIQNTDSKEDVKFVMRYYEEQLSGGAKMSGFLPWLLWA